MFSRTAERWGAGHAGNCESLQRVPQGFFGKQIKLQIIWTVFKILHSLVRFPLCPSSGDGAQDLRHGRWVLCHWSTPKPSSDQRGNFNARESQLYPPWMGVTLESRQWLEGEDPPWLSLGGASDPAGCKPEDGEASGPSQDRLSGITGSKDDSTQTWYQLRRLARNWHLGRCEN